VAYTVDAGPGFFTVGADATVESILTPSNQLTGSVALDNGFIRDTLTFLGVTSAVDITFNLVGSHTVGTSGENDGGLDSQAAFVASLSAVRIGGLGPNANGNQQKSTTNTGGHPDEPAG